jgi:hypothetical protein
MYAVLLLANTGATPLENILTISACFAVLIFVLLFFDPSREPVNREKIQQAIQRITEGRKIIRKDGAVFQTNCTIYGSKETLILQTSSSAVITIERSTHMHATEGSPHTMSNYRVEYADPSDTVVISEHIIPLCQRYGWQEEQMGAQNILHWAIRLINRASNMSKLHAEQATSMM